MQPPGAAVRPRLRARVSCSPSGASPRPSTSCKVTEPDLETIRLYAAAYTAGELTLHASPSLFGGAKCIVVHDLDEADDELQADLLTALAGEPEPDLTARRAAQGRRRAARRCSTRSRGPAPGSSTRPAIKTDRDKTDFAAHEFRRGPSQGHRRGGARPRRGRRQGRARARGRLPAAHRRHHRRHRRAGRAAPTTGARSRRPASGSPTRRWPATPARRCGCSGTPSPSVSTRCRSWPCSPSRRAS